MVYLRTKCTKYEENKPPPLTFFFDLFPQISIGQTIANLVDMTKRHIVFSPRVMNF